MWRRDLPPLFIDFRFLIVDNTNIFNYNKNSKSAQKIQEKKLCFAQIAEAI